MTRHMDQFYQEKQSEVSNFGAAAGATAREAAREAAVTSAVTA
jgi:hypothetical protein